ASRSRPRVPRRHQPARRPRVPRPRPLSPCPALRRFRFPAARYRCFHPYRFASVVIELTSARNNGGRLLSTQPPLPSRVLGASLLGLLARPESACFVTLRFANLPLFAKSRSTSNPALPSSPAKPVPASRFW